jgi:hypothetical protein
LCTATVGAKFCTDRVGCESRGGVDGFGSASGELVGDAAAILDVATGASEFCNVVPIAGFTGGSCGATTAGGAVGAFALDRGSLLAFDSASCKLVVGTRVSGDGVGSSECGEGVSVRTINSTLCRDVVDVDMELIPDELAVDASAFAGVGTLGDALKMSQLGTMRPTAIAPAPTATPPTAATNPNKRKMFDCFVSEDSDCCDFIITSPTCATTEAQTRHAIKTDWTKSPAESDGRFLGLCRDVQHSLASSVPRPERIGGGRAGARVRGDLQGNASLATLIENADFSLDPQRDICAQWNELSQGRAMIHCDKVESQIGKTRRCRRNRDPDRVSES